MEDVDNVIPGPWTTDQQAVALRRHVRHLVDELDANRPGRMLMDHYFEHLYSEYE